MNKKKTLKKRNSLEIGQLIAYVFPCLMILIGTILLNLYPMFGFRWYIIIFLIIIYLMLASLSTLFKIKKMQKSQIAAIVFSILFGLGVTFCDYLYFNAVRTMDAISTSSGDIVTSALFVHADDPAESLEDLKNKAIATQPSSSITMYEMLLEGIEKADMDKNDFVLSPYQSYLTAYKDFLDHKIDAIVLDSQAISGLKEIYPDFDSTVKKIETFTKIMEISKSSNVDVSKEPFTVLINGVDIRSGNLNEAANADVIMLATFNPQTMKLSLNSIPRDTYLPVTCRGFSDKITHSGSGGVSCTIDSLEETFGIDIDYYVKVNFFAVVDLVDALGGIEVDVPFSFTEQDSGDNANAITLEAGLQTLNGEQALAMSRHRKTLPRGDIDRGLNQQLVIEGILKKAASSAAMLNVDSLLKVVENNVQTNMPTSQMYGLFQLLTNIGSSSKYGNLSALNIQMKTIEGTDDMHVPPYSSLELYFYLPYNYSIENTTRDIRRILGLESYPLPTNTFAFNANVSFDDLDDESKYYMDNDIGSTSYGTPDVTDYSDPTENAEESYAIMPNFSGDSYGTMLNWCSSVNAELPDGYSISCQFSTDDGSSIQDGAIFVSASTGAGATLSRDTLYPGDNIIHFILRNPTVSEPEEPIDPEEPNTPENPETPIDPIDPEEPIEPTPPDSSGDQGYE